VFGLPILLWAVVLVAPSLASSCALAIVGVQAVYFLLSPTAERAVWTLLSYLFSVGGAPLVLYGTTFATVPGWITWLSYLLIPFIAAIRLGRRYRWRGCGIVVPCVALTLTGFFSMLVNQASPNDWIGWTLHNLRYPLLFLVLRNSPLGIVQYRAITGAFLVLVLIQIPATGLQYVVSSLSPTGWNEDQTVGTMYGAQTGLMGLTVVVGFASLFSSALISRRHPLVILACFAVWLPLIVGGAGFSLVLGVLLAGYILLRSGFDVRQRATMAGGMLRMRRHVLALIPLSALATGGFMLASIMMFQDRGTNAASRNDDTNTASRSELTDWLTGRSANLTSLAAFTDPNVAVDQSRQRFIATAFQWFSRHPADLVLGSLGPRIALGQSVSRVSTLSSEVTASETASVGTTTSPLETINRDVGLPPNAVQFVVQLPRTLLEVGLVGLACFIWLHWQAWQIGWRAARRAGVDPWIRSQVLAFEAIWLLYALLTVLYLDVWRVDQTGFAFWLWTAALASVAYGMPTPPSARSNGTVETTA